MTQNNQQQYETRLFQLNEIIKQKNQVITHLTTRIKNQQKQIQNLVKDAESKHHHEISKYYSKSYQKYLKNGKYLLLKVDEIQDNGIFLPNNVKIVHFGELQVSNWGRTESFGSGTKGEKGLIDFGTANTEKTTINEQKSEDFKEIDLNKKESSSLQKTCQSLSKQIETLKQNLKNYTSLVKTNKQASAIKQETHQQQHQIDPYGVESVIRYENTPQKNKMQDSNKSENSKQKNKFVEEFPSISPIKKKNKTKTIFIRKK